MPLTKTLFNLFRQNCNKAATQLAAAVSGSLKLAVRFILDPIRFMKHLRSLKSNFVCVPTSSFNRYLHSRTSTFILETRYGYVDYKINNWRCGAQLVSIYIKYEGKSIGKPRHNLCDEQILNRLLIFCVNNATSSNERTENSLTKRMFAILLLG